MSDIKKSDENEVFDRSNSTTFGRSVESEAQQTDAAGRSSPLPGSDQPLHLYRLVPTAWRTLAGKIRLSRVRC